MYIKEEGAKHCNKYEKKVHFLSGEELYTLETDAEKFHDIYCFFRHILLCKLRMEMQNTAINMKKMHFLKRGGVLCP